MTQELCSFCLNQSCQSTSPPHTSPFIGSAGISGISKMCIQIRYLRDLQFCAAPVQQCVLQYVQTPCLQSFLSCFQGPLSAICFFFEVLVIGRMFPDFPLTTLTFLVWFFLPLACLKMNWLQWGDLFPYFSCLWGWSVRVQIWVWQNVCVVLQCCQKFLLKFLIHVA